MNGTAERIVVVLDAASENRAAIGAAARLAARWKVRLHGIFVEDDELIRLARLPFARQVTLGVGVETLTLQQAERQLRAFAERARHDLVVAARRHSVEATFEIVREATSRDAVAGLTADFLVAGTATRPIGGHFRVECRWWSLQPAPASFLLAHHDWRQQGTVAVMLQDRDAAADRVLEIAARLAEGDGGRLVVICAPGLAEAADFKIWLDERLARHGVTVELEVALPDPAAQIRRVGELECRLVALEAGAALAQPDRLRELVTKIGCDVLVVR